MPSTITSAVVDAKNELHNLSPWLWIFEVVLDDSEAIRVAGFDAEVTHRGQTYRPFPVAIGIQSRDRQGILQEAEVRISNIGAFVSNFLEAGQILGEKCTVRLVSEEEPDDVAFEAVYEVLKATVSIDAAVFRLAHHGLMDSPLPAQLFNRTRCRHRYGRAGCQYNTALPNAISGSNPSFDPSTCDLTLDGPNGCRAHGDNEVANGAPRHHPMLWGGFRGIPKGPARV